MGVAGSSGIYTRLTGTVAGVSATASTAVSSLCPSSAAAAARYWPSRKKNKAPLTSRPADEM